MTELIHTFKVDASYHLKRKVTGIGIVIHETDKPKKNGIVIDEISELYFDIPANVTEKFAIFRALEIALERNYEIVRIRSDYNYMRRQLKEDHKMNTGHERDDLHGFILRYAKKFKEVKFLYQSRKKNHAAHRLARKAVGELISKRGKMQLNFQSVRWYNMLA